jgi:hypothetical protein
VLQIFNFRLITDHPEMRFLSKDGVDRLLDCKSLTDTLRDAFANAPAIVVPGRQHYKLSEGSGSEQRSDDALLLMPAWEPQAGKMSLIDVLASGTFIYVVI